MRNRQNQRNASALRQARNNDMAAPFAAEHAAHVRFGAASLWRGEDFAARFRRGIPGGVATMLESLPFFFIATANALGECDCSFRGREYDAAGRAYRLVKVIDTETLVFPDYRGNQYYNSLGNILQTGQIGMLFIDFTARRRVRVNGRAEIIDDPNVYAAEWPLAQRYVRVSVEQVFGNCQARVPRMRPVDPDDYELQEQ
jgi:predicted pyridoxine 5'-phosphate oxidase superfamily flavin-nucleotide-binding protein